MVEKIVPLSEPFVAALVITLQDLNVTLTARVLVSEDSELLSIWDVLLYLNAS